MCCTRRVQESAGLVDLTDSYLSLGYDGNVTNVPVAKGPPSRLGGYLLGGGFMTRAAPHGGEIHPDGDEVLLVISGGIDVILEEPDGDRRVAVDPGRAFVVPRSIWHRVELREPSHVLFLTPGPGGEHRPL